MAGNSNRSGADRPRRIEGGRSVIPWKQDGGDGTVALAAQVVADHDRLTLLGPDADTVSALGGSPDRVLAADEALISIYVGAERSYVWAVSKSGKAAFAEVALTDADVFINHSDRTD